MWIEIVGNNEKPKNTKYENHLKKLAEKLGCSSESLSQSMGEYRDYRANEEEVKKNKTVLNDIQDADDIFSEIASNFDCYFSTAPRKCLKKLKKIGLPEVLINFYSTKQPVNCKVKGICIHDANRVISENTELCPGWVSAQYGYFVFASNEYGDAFCFDVNKTDNSKNPRIVFISHETVCDESTEDDVHELIVPVAQNLNDFLVKLCKGEIEEFYE